MLVLCCRRLLCGIVARVCVEHFPYAIQARAPLLNLSFHFSDDGDS